MNDNDPLTVWGWRLCRLFVILGLLWDWNTMKGLLEFLCALGCCGGLWLAGMLALAAVAAASGKYQIPPRE